MRSLVALALAALVSPIAGAADSELEQLTQWMTGTFSSEAQSLEDPAFRHIVLHMVRIWPGSTDGVWLYVEQAVAEAADKPYRQRVYHLRRVGEDLFASSVFTFDEPLAKAGAWRQESPLSDLSPADLTQRDGCTIYLVRRADGAFAGSTLGRLCTSNLGGATWASSEVVITADGMVSWDRGWDDAGAQVWGAEKAGYRFDRAAIAAEQPAP
jgi:CpeT protein